jgi:hypothetical protein
MTSPADPPWLTEGGMVAVVNDRSPIRFAHVARLTKRDAVLDDGQRFNRARLSQSTGGAWGTIYFLHDPASESVMTRYRIQRRARIRASYAIKVEPMIVRWSSEGDDNLLAEVITALETARFRLAELDPA